MPSAYPSPPASPPHNNWSCDCCETCYACKRYCTCNNGDYKSDSSSSSSDDEEEEDESSEEEDDG